MSRQKQKGNAFERKIAEHLTNVFNLKFFRSPGSGAYVGGRNITRANELTNAQMLLLEGDIVVPEELSFLKFECKTLKTLSFSSLLTNCAIMDDWIEQARSEDKLWFLIFKINNRGTFIVYSEALYDQFDHESGERLIYKGNVIEAMGDFFSINKQILLNGSVQY